MGEGKLLQDSLPGRLPGNELPLNPASVDLETTVVKPNPKYHPTKDQPALDYRLIEWLKVEHATDSLCAVCPPHLILSQTQHLNLTRVHPTKITSPPNIMALIEESAEWGDEWANKIFKVLVSFNADLATLNGQKGKKQKRTQ